MDNVPIERWETLWEYLSKIQIVHQRPNRKQLVVGMTAFTGSLHQLRSFGEFHTSETAKTVFLKEPKTLQWFDWISTMQMGLSVVDDSRVNVNLALHRPHTHPETNDTSSDTPDKISARETQVEQSSYRTLPTVLYFGHAKFTIVHYDTSGTELIAISTEHNRRYAIILRKLDSLSRSVNGGIFIAVMIQLPRLVCHLPPPHQTTRMNGIGAVQTALDLWLCR